MDSRKILLTIIAIILVLLIGAGGYGTYYFRKQSFDQKKTNTDLQSQIDSLKKELDAAKKSAATSASSSDCASTLTDEENSEITDWKSYTNNSGYYSFKYPTEWTLNSNDTERITLTGTDSDEDITLQIATGEATQTGFEDFTLVSTQDIKIGCESAKETTFDQGDNKTLIAALVTHSSNPYLFIYTFKNIGASYAGDIVHLKDLILKTFQFTN